MSQWLLRCIWLLVPAFVWNGIFWSSLPQKGFSNDGIVPSWILWSEHILRVVVFVGPVFLPLRWDDRWSRMGWWLFGAGTLIYFATWLPLLYAPQSGWSLSVLGPLGPSLTPLLWMLGIALIGGSWPYAIAAFAFTAIHVVHNLIAFLFIKL